MDERILNKVCIYQQDPEKLLSCCKNFTLERICNIRWKNRIYFRDNRIKIINCEINYLNYKHLWLKEGKEHRDDIDPKTGITIYSNIGYYDDGHYKSFLYKQWYKNGKKHRDEIDPNTGITLPAENSDDGLKYWWENGERHRDEIDIETGLTLPAIIYFGAKKWQKDGENHRDEIDPETGLTLPASIWEDGDKDWYKDGKFHRDEFDPDTGLTLSINEQNGSKYWYKNGKRHRDDIDPETCLALPAEIREDGSKFWYKDGIEFNPKFERIYSLFSKRKNILFLSIGAILPILYFINKK